MREKRQDPKWIPSCQNSFMLKWECTEASVLLLFSAVVVDVVSELARDGMISELLYADDIVLMNGKIQTLGNCFRKWN